MPMGLCDGWRGLCQALSGKTFQPTSGRRWDTCALESLLARIRGTFSPLMRMLLRLQSFWKDAEPSKSWASKRSTPPRARKCCKRWG